MWLFSKFSNHPVILLPESYPVFDLSRVEDVTLADASVYGIGRYNEKREQMYQTEIFEGRRNIHIGIDIFAPVGTPIHSFSDGRIFLFGNNDNPGDYGYTLITEHEIGGKTIYALYGHLNEKSIQNKVHGQPIRAGEVVAWIGDRHENGNWTPHLHFQLSVERPKKADMPGVVSDADHSQALLTYPDPRIVLGPIYL